MQYQSLWFERLYWHYPGCFRTFKVLNFKLNEKHQWTDTLQKDEGGLGQKDQSLYLKLFCSGCSETGQLNSEIYGCSPSFEILLF